MKTQKGMTLTALVITIIVMLILVVVVINFAVGDEGILTNSKTASAETEKKAILEELISMAIFDEDGIDLDKILDGAGAKYGTENVSGIEGNGKLTITGKTGTYSYKVTSAGISIWDDGDNPPPPEDDEEKGTIITNEELLKRLGITDYTGTYTGTWELIKKENGTKTFVTTEDVGQCTLGNNDINESIQDYIDAVSKIGNVVTTATQEIYARSVNIEDIEEILEIGEEEKIADNPCYGEKYEYYYNNGSVYSRCQPLGTNTWGDDDSSGYTSFIIVENGVEKTVDASSPGPVYLTNDEYNIRASNDPTKKATLGTLGNGAYWLASPGVACYPDCVVFYVQYMDNGDMKSNDLFEVNGSTNINTLDVRAIVSVPV